MSRKRYTAEEIINKLHEADVLTEPGEDNYGGGTAAGDQ